MVSSGEYVFLSILSALYGLVAVRLIAALACGGRFTPLGFRRWLLAGAVISLPRLACLLYVATMTEGLAHSPRLVRLALLPESFVGETLNPQFFYAEYWGGVRGMWAFMAGYVAFASFVLAAPALLPAIEKKKGAGRVYR